MITRVRRSVPYVLVESPLNNPFAAIVIVAVLLAVIAFGVVVLFLGLENARGDELQVFFEALAICLIAAIPAFLVLNFLDRREREARWLYWGALLWGALVATGLALVFNQLGLLAVLTGISQNQALHNLSHAQQQVTALFATAVLVAPLVEETVKGLAIFVIAWLFPGEFNDMRDGLIYGGLIGLGFNLIEAPIYVLNGYAATGSAPFGEQIVARFVFGGLNGHLLFTALTGAGIGLARQHRGTLRKAFYAIGGLILAMLSHGVYNLLSGFFIALYLGLMGIDVTANQSISLMQWWLGVALANLSVSIVPYALLIVAIFSSERREQRVIREQLAGEVGGAVTSGEYQGVLSEPLFGLRRAASYPAAVGRKIVNAQNKLAFRKQQVSIEGRDPGADATVVEWREYIAGLRAA